MRDADIITKKLLLKMNSSADHDEIRNMLSQITGSEIEKSVVVFTPRYINYGKHTRIGQNVFINFDCVFMDMVGITIDDNLQISPKVSILTADHPIEFKERLSLIPKPIHIKQDAWIGAGANFLQGVTIGENSVVAAGAVVSKDVPDNVIAGVIPAKIIKAI